MPKPSKEEADERKADKHKVEKLTAPMHKTTMEPAKNHPQRLVLIEREKMKPTANLEAWFEVGLVRAFTEADDNNAAKNYVTGGRPLPLGYSGCDGEKALIEAVDSEIIIWPIRVSLHGGPGELKKPMTLYHYTHKASFENLHRIFHEMGTRDPEDVAKEIVLQLQNDYQERVPNPTNINSKGEPQLTIKEPCTFHSKKDVLSHVFGKDPTGYSKLGNRYDCFADYCVAVVLPGQAAFPNLNQSSGANVRICRETLDQLVRRANLEEKEEKAKADKSASGHHVHHDGDQDAGKKGCLARLFGARRPEKMENWDEAETPEKSKKKDRELDRWKQRLAKKWLAEHVEECAQHTAHDAKSKAEVDKRAHEEQQKQEKLKHSQNKVQHAIQVNERKKVGGFDFGINRAWNDFVSKFTPDKAAKLAEQHYKQDANRDVANSSSLFKVAGKKKSIAGEEDEDENEAKVADDHMKRMWRAGEVEEKKKAPTGTRRKAVRKKGQKTDGDEAGQEQRRSTAPMDGTTFQAIQELELKMLREGSLRLEGTVAEHEEKEKKKKGKEDEDKGSKADSKEGSKEGSKDAKEPEPTKGKKASIVSPRSDDGHDQPPQKKKEETAEGDSSKTEGDVAEKEAEKEAAPTSSKKKGGDAAEKETTRVSVASMDSFEKRESVEAEAEAGGKKRSSSSSKESKGSKDKLRESAALPNPDDVKAAIGLD